MTKYKQTVQKLLDSADIKINGSRPEDIHVLNDKLYPRVIAEANLGLGEGYMDGWWTCKAIDKFIYKILCADLQSRIKKTPSMALLYLKAKFSNNQKTRAKHIGQWHYDIGNELYKSMLDKNMNYSCGYWKNAKTLDQAQIDKMELICKKLKLKKGMRVLDIGCGWGTLARYMAKNYSARVVGVTVSKEQAKLAKELNKGLPVEIRIQDYRELNEKFDCIVSVGMIEHVGPKNYKEYMNVADRCLKEDGLFLLHTIGSATSHVSGEPWTDKYIFPDGVIPSIKQLSAACEQHFLIEDLHNFGADYDKTLMAWHANFTKAWPKLKKNYDERFKRMWDYYLLSCAGSFRARNNQLWQLVLSKKGVKGVYEIIR
ncbi:cyclopropane-fatty-acyl-phospholipid synthase [Candidatus Woesearchaeota archaeon CG10_big_fil_rev_8_21_14_0_10_32_9]|nr:MAG: cyclopropane-fatty-acyl-phospholipid synthase [Candidatus Woesearchaeota archaeon CG10_big_fil_rev_8_21_14_0_10_32_9]